MIYIVIPRAADRTEGERAFMLTRKKEALKLAKRLDVEVFTYDLPITFAFDISTVRTCLPRIE